MLFYAICVYLHTGTSFVNGVNAKMRFLSANERSKGEGKGKEEEGKGSNHLCDLKHLAKQTCFYHLPPYIVSIAGAIYKADKRFFFLLKSRLQ